MDARYWGWGGNAFAWNEGYWGSTIGFYGGVNYGFGYGGVGYQADIGKMAPSATTPR